MPTPSTPATPASPRDSVRETFETIVFVVSLVLMLKLFVVEAFVIPTGSMAETLYGYQKIAHCPECEHEFPVNASNEVQPWDGHPKVVSGACCPNCRHRWQWKKEDSPANRSGDRVLVLKPLYTFGKPQRGDVVVFKYPVDPQVNFEAQNYIKRLWGLGGETLAIWRGDLYVSHGIDYPAEAEDTNGYPLYPRPEGADFPRRLWEGPAVDSKTGYRQIAPYQTGFVYHNAHAALAAFEESRRTGFPAGVGFDIIRKSDEHALAMRRLVYDNDHQAAGLTRAGVPPRWTPEGSGWTPDDPKAPRIFRHEGPGRSWVRYLHRVPGPISDVRPQDDGNVFGRRILADDWMKLESHWHPGLFSPHPITNFLGYNAGIEDGGMPRDVSDHWVGDLMIECTATFLSTQDEVVLELSEGARRYQARFAEGAVTLVQTGPGAKDLATRPTGIAAGTHELRFANIDDRLRVWVDGSAVDFGTEADVRSGDGGAFAAAVATIAGAAFGPLTPRGDNTAHPNFPEGPTGFSLANDILAPAGIAASGGVTVKHLKLWEDTFFTPAANQAYANPADPVDTFYIHPGHYLCLGDNSGQSSDSRKWGLVPERLMLGKAVFVFYPFPPFTEWRNNRLGFIQ